MSELNKLQGKSKVFKIGEVDMEIHPLGLDELHLFAVDESMSLKERSIAESEMVRNVLKNSFPDATDEEINGIGISYVNEIKQAILEVNGIKIDKVNPIELAKQRQAEQAKAEAVK